MRSLLQPVFFEENPDLMLVDLMPIFVFIRNFKEHISSIEVNVL